ncbi:hypothetical protein ACIFOT_12160 [Neobacillus sp. NRS-1170]|uniref:hypothetical protein n=1 Tax=Neobacillus sp. NRS-1170 TaxID=3233898 RepID=UPI003D2A05DB
MSFNNKYQIYFYFPLFLLAFSLLLPIQALAEVITDTPPPTAVSIGNIKVVDGITNITGKVSDNQTPSGQILLELVDENSQLVQTIVPTTDGTWTYSGQLSVKINSLFIKATDTAGNIKTVPVDNTRPHVKALNISVFLSKDRNTKEEVTKQVDLIKTDDMTRVSLNPTITIDLLDNDVLDNQNFTNPLTVFNKKGNVNGTISVNDQKQIVFALKDLTPSTTYYIMFNSSLTDDAGNAVFPVIKKFTTVSSTVNDADIDIYPADSDKQPHGYYTNNVNTCINCHNTHVSESSNLESPKSTYSPKDQSLMDSYCMACHDGTTAAPMPENYGSDSLSKHETQSSDHHSKAGSCTSCHNPHLTWSMENPNFLMDHYVYKHKDEDKVDGVKVGEVDSRYQLCEKCHELNTNYYKNLARDLVKQLNDPNNPDAYRVMHYRKLSSKGNIKDYDLCFSCHNEQKEAKDGTKDILTYYNDSTSKHLITAMDGSILNGNIPCSECHQTHGSKNLYLLKSKYGHENQEDAVFSFTTGMSWDTAKEREFCMKCHNASNTSIFGLAAGLPSQGHELTSSEKCSACHSTSGTFMEAAHAPKASNRQLPVATPQLQAKSTPSGGTNTASEATSTPSGGTSTTSAAPSTPAGGTSTTPEGTSTLAAGTSATPEGTSTPTGGTSTAPEGTGTTPIDTGTAP